MSGLRCARCGRLEPPQEAVDGVAEDPLIALLGGALASIDGEDICPRHQTPAERRDLARRIVSAIETDIKRSTELDPSPVEPGLAVFAMQLREALAAAEKANARPSASGSVASSSLGSHIHLDVAITGAFMTGYPLRIGIGEYDSVQRELATKLSENTGAGWTTGAAELPTGSYHSGGGFSDVIPLVLVCRSGVDLLTRTREILDRRPAPEQDWLKHRTEGWTVEPRSMRIEVYDLGVAVINGTFAVEVPAAVPLQAVARRLKEMVWLRPDDVDNVSSPITGMFRKLSKETARQFRASVDAAVPARRMPPWLPASTNHGSQQWGRLLWLHPVHILTSKDREKRESGAKELAPEFSQHVDLRDGRFVPGIGWSAIVTDDDPSTRVMPLKLVHLHWAYIALYMEIDRGLLVFLDRDKSVTKRPLLSESEEYAKQTFDDYLRVMKARARVDSALASLGGDEQAIWDVIAEVQKFDSLVDGVDRKVEVLQRIADRRVQEAASASSRRSAIILGLLTTLTLVTLATTLLGYFLGGLSDEDKHPYLRWSILGLGVLLAVLLWSVTFQVRPRRRKGKPRRSAS